jgi:hypothetical protein
MFYFREERTLLDTFSTKNHNYEIKIGWKYDPNHLKARIDERGDFDIKWLVNRAKNAIPKIERKNLLTFGHGKGLNNADQFMVIPRSGETKFPMDIEWDARRKMLIAIVPTLLDKKMVGKFKETEIFIEEIDSI